MNFFSGRFGRALQVLLSYALLWPITQGDKIVRLRVAACDAQAVSSPWALYRELGSTFAGAQEAGPQSPVGLSGGSVDDSEPDAFLPVQKPQRQTSPGLRLQALLPSAARVRLSAPSWPPQQPLPPPLVPAAWPQLESKR